MGMLQSALRLLVREEQGGERRTTPNHTDHMLRASDRRREATVQLDQLVVLILPRVRYFKSSHSHSQDSSLLLLLFPTQELISSDE